MSVIGNKHRFTTNSGGANNCIRKFKSMMYTQLQSSGSNVIIMSKRYYLLFWSKIV